MHRIVSTWTTSHEAEPSSSWRASGVRLRVGHGLGLGLGLGLRLRLAVRVQAQAQAEAEVEAEAEDEAAGEEGAANALCDEWVASLEEDDASRVRIVAEQVEISKSVSQ